MAPAGAGESFNPDLNVADVERKRWDFAAAGGVAAPLPILWATGQLEPTFSESALAVPFVLLMLAAALWCGYSAAITVPLIRATSAQLAFCSIRCPWRTARVRVDDIEEIGTDWWPHTTRCRVTLRLSAGAFAATAGDWTWIARRDNWVAFDLTHARMNPHDAAEMLAKICSRPYFPKPQP